MELPSPFREAASVNIFKALVRKFLWINIVLECFSFFFLFVISMFIFIITINY